MRLKIDWASLIVGSKFTVFALFYFVFEGNFPITSPPGAYIWRGDLTEGFLRYRFEWLIHGEAYFRNFTVIFCEALIASFSNLVPCRFELERVHDKSFFANRRYPAPSFHAL